MGRRQTPSLLGLAKWRSCCCLLAPTWPGHLPGFSHGGREARSLAGSQEGGRPSPAGWWLSGGLRTPLLDWYLLIFSFASCFQYNELCLKLLTVPCCCVKRGPVILLYIWRLLLRICFPSHSCVLQICVVHYCLTASEKDSRR